MISIRPAKESDLEDILEIYNEIIIHTTAVFDYNPHTLGMRRAWYETKLKDGFPVFVAEENNHIVGFSSIGHFRAWDAYKYTVENSVYVSVNERGKGIGKSLIPPLIKAAKEKNMHVIIASIESANTASLKLHSYFGFEEVAHFKEVGYKFDRWLDLKFLQLILKH
jgi:L-amino acid N-acyltransferase YncA